MRADDAAPSCYLDLLTTLSLLVHSDVVGGSSTEVLPGGAYHPGLQSAVACSGCGPLWQARPQWGLARSRAERTVGWVMRRNWHHLRAQGATSMSEPFLERLRQGP